MAEEHCIVCGDIIPEGRQVCPICNREFGGIPALSRKDNKTLICYECSVRQALDDAFDSGIIVCDDKEELTSEILNAMNKSSEDIRNGKKY